MLDGFEAIVKLRSPFSDQFSHTNPEYEQIKYEHWLQTIQNVRDKNEIKQKTFGILLVRDAFHHPKHSHQQEQSQVQKKTENKPNVSINFSVLLSEMALNLNKKESGSYFSLFLSFLEVHPFTFRLTWKILKAVET